jgi:cytochrome c
MKRFLLALSILPLAVATNAWAQSDGDAKNGQTVFATCKACHSLDAGKNGVGPSLHGLFGRKAGTAPGYSYSEAMKTANVTWDEETLEKYLADPKAFVPGNKMPFLGVKDEKRRRDVIAYLKDASK